jgi:serine/threonine-protein kinase
MAPAADTLIGRELMNGQFRILERLGSGGMGVVYTALQPEMNRKVAVKVLHPKLSARKDLASRLRREARAMSQMSHPSIAKVFLHGELDDGGLYVVMELLEGRNLKEAIRADGPFTPERALPILLAVCGALAEAHAAGIIHRDLKPDNIFLCQSGTLVDFPKVLDFGLAKVTENQMRPGSLVLTGDHEVFGTPRYMSPEQAQGKPLTPVSDIYSLGLILYETLTGQSPFDARDALEYTLLQVKAPPVPLSLRVPGRVFPAELERVVMKTLAKSPAGRFGSATELAAALHGVLETMHSKPVVAVGSTPAAGLATAALAPRDVVSQTAPIVALPAAAPRTGWVVALVIGAFLLGVALTVALMRTFLR